MSKAPSQLRQEVKPLSPRAQRISAIITVLFVWGMGIFFSLLILTSDGLVALKIFALLGAIAIPAWHTKDEVRLAFGRSKRTE